MNVISSLFFSQGLNSSRRRNRTNNGDRVVKKIVLKTSNTPRVPGYFNKHIKANKVAPSKLQKSEVRTKKKSALSLSKKLSAQKEIEIIKKKKLKPDENGFMKIDCKKRLSKISAHHEEQNRIFSIEGRSIIPMHIYVKRCKGEGKKVDCRDY
ncbi:MAG TPA: hypothetical protein VGJ00_03555 [Rhabdochlamydiaceae bacterium]|jgi:hypothetical protein